MIRRFVVVMLLSSFLAVPCGAAKPTVPGSFLKARMVTAEGKRIEAFKVNLDRDSLSYIPKSQRFGGSAPATIATESLRYLEVQTGTRTGTYALLGAAGGVLGALLGILQVEADPNLDTSGANLGLFVVGFGAAGMGIGAIVGAATPVFTPLRKNGQWLEDQGLRLDGFHDSQSVSLGFRVTYSF